MTLKKEENGKFFFYIKGKTSLEMSSGAVWLKLLYAYEAL